MEIDMSNTFENQLIYDVRQKRVRRIKTQLTTNLMRLGEQTSFAVGEGLHVCGEGYSLLLRCVHLDDEHFGYGGTLMAGFPIGEEVEGIGWSIVNSAGQSIASGVTRPGGHFAFDLPTSTHRRGEPMQLQIGQAVAPSLGERAETTRMVETVADAVAGAGEATSDVHVRRSPSELWRIVMDFSQVVMAAPDQSPTYATASGEHQPGGRDRENVFIDCSIDDISSGLCRLHIEELDGTITNYYPAFDPDTNDGWLFQASIWDLLGGRYPTNPDEVNVAVVPATADNAGEFDNDSVRRLIESLPVDSEQRRRAERFLETKGTGDD
jgi:hypothetical protein